jgi:transposase
VFTARDRCDQLVERLLAMLPSWSMAPLVAALRGLRGIDFLSAVTFVAAVGDLGRFATPRQLMGISAWCRPNSPAGSAWYVAGSPRPAIAKPGEC